MEFQMSAILRFFRRRFMAPVNPTTHWERARLAQTMPGETGARAGERYGFLIC